MLLFDVEMNIEIETLEQGPFQFMRYKFESTIDSIHEKIAMWFVGEGDLTRIDHFKYFHGQVEFLRVKLFMVEILRYLSSDIFNISTTNRILVDEGMKNVKDLCID